MRAPASNLITIISTAGKKFSTRFEQLMSTISMAAVTSFVKSRELSREIWKFQNEVRQNPKILIPLIEEDLKYFKGKSIWAPGQPGMSTDEGASAWKEAIEFVRNQPPVQTLEWSDDLEASAMDHAYDLGPKGRTGHTGSDNSSISARIERHGKWHNIHGENISFGPANAQYIIKQLVIDDSTPSRGHRDNVFQSAFGVVGIACAPHTVFGSTCVLDYAGAMSPGRTAAGYRPAAASDAVFDIAIRKEAQLDKARSLAADLPQGCVSRSVKTTTRVRGDQRTVTTTTTFRFADGREETTVQVADASQSAKSIPVPAAGPTASTAAHRPAANAGRPSPPAPAAASTSASPNRIVPASGTRPGFAPPRRAAAAVPFAHLFAGGGARAATDQLAAEYGLCDGLDAAAADPAGAGPRVASVAAAGALGARAGPRAGAGTGAGAGAGAAAAAAAAARAGAKPALRLGQPPLAARVARAGGVRA